MGNNPFLDYWGTEIHKDPAHLSSIAKAVKKDTSPVRGSLDKEKRMCLFPADNCGNVYTTTLFECNGPSRPCGSPTRPCKHMYRLDMELGLFDGKFETGVNKNLQLSASEAIPLVDALPYACQEKVKDFLYICYSDGDRPFCIEASDKYAPLLSFPLLSPIPVSTDALYNLYSTKRDIFPLLDRAAPNAPRELSKKKLFQWCADNLSDMFYAFTFVPDFRRAQHTVYSHLLKKFPNLDDDTI